MGAAGGGGAGAAQAGAVSTGAAGGGGTTGEAHEGAGVALAGCPQLGQKPAPTGYWAPQLRHVAVPWLGLSVIRFSLGLLTAG
jgi:hypothetical protein